MTASGVHRQAGRDAEAKEAMRRATTMYEAAAALEPDDLQIRCELVRQWDERDGRERRDGRFLEAIDAYDESARILGEIIARYPKAAGLLDELLANGRSLRDVIQGSRWKASGRCGH